MRGTDKGTYQRTANSLLIGQPRPARIARFNGIKLLTGTASLHRTAMARRWRLFWRLKSKRWVQRMRQDEPMTWGNYDAEDDLK